MSDIKERLSQDVANTSWQDLLPHAKRDVLIVIDPQLDIIDVSDVPTLIRPNTV